MLQQYAGALTVPDLQHYPRYEYIRRLMVSLAPVSVIRSNAHRTRCVRGSRTPDSRVIIQKSKEATASSASLLATPMHYKGGRLIFNGGHIIGILTSWIK